jgi:hypothetical protein
MRTGVGQLTTERLQLTGVAGAKAVVVEPARAIRDGQWIGRIDITQPVAPATFCVLARSNGLRCGQFLGRRVRILPDRTVNVAKRFRTGQMT